MPRGARFTTFVLVLLVALAGTAPALAQGPVAGPVAPQDSDPAWQAWYWNNMAFAGAPALQRPDAAINFDWGAGAPGPGVAADQFSARWTRYIYAATAGSYRFTATADDGIRVWVDNQAIINGWSDHSALTYSADLTLAAGHHLVVVEYYENGGVAVAKVSWGATPQTIYNWRGEYYNNPSLSGSPSLVRDDTFLNFDWGTGSPAPGLINSDYFSARWTRTVDLPAGNYVFTVNVDDGARLWVNGHLLINTWQIQSPHAYQESIYLPGGRTDIKLEYYENNGGAVCQFNWVGSGGTVPPPPPPPPAGGEVLVEDGGVGFSSGGSPTAWHTAFEGSGGRLIWTRNNDWARPNYNWARWYPSYNGLAAGRYEVYVYIPERYSTTSAANYWISHSGGFTRRIVNQAAYGGQWVSLGTYWFRGNQSDYVSLSDVTGEPYISRLIAFDAIKWMPR